MKMSPKRMPLEELTNLNNATYKRARSHRAAASKAAAAISELVSATAEWNKEQHSSDTGPGNAVLEPTSKSSLLPKPQKKRRRHYRYRIHKSLQQSRRVHVRWLLFSRWKERSIKENRTAFGI